MPRKSVYMLSTLVAERIFSRSRDWLLGLWAQESFKSTARVEDLLTLMLGLWICKAAPGDDSIQMGPLAANLANAIDLASSGEGFDPFRYDAKLLLLAHQLLSSYGFHVTAIESFASSIALGMGELGQVPSTLIGECLLLSQLGLVAPPAVPMLSRRSACLDGTSLMRLDRPEVVSICNNVAAASHFGLKPLRSESGMRSMLKELLPPRLLQALRQYDLELGATILRTMRYTTGPNNAWEFRLGVSFLTDQQDKKGRFGWLSREETAVAEAGVIAPEDVTTRLYLPITVSCLWALAESLFAKFTLIGSCTPARLGLRASDLIPPTIVQSG
jgi:hypothetical protein